MRLLVQVSFVVLLTVIGTVHVAAQRSETVRVQINSQKRLAKSRITIRFVDLIDDSRCPVDTNCVWAGNAKIKVRLTKGRKSRTVEMNTGLEPRSIRFEDYEVRIIKLIPEPASNIRIRKDGYVATFSVTRQR